MKKLSQFKTMKKTLMGIVFLLEDKQKVKPLSVFENTILFSAKTGLK
jgi:hypothetical protein